MTIVGTNCFVTKTRARAYYAEYGLSSLDVEHKISTNEISIGCPVNVSTNARVYIDQSEGRYMVEIRG